jgi:hypothetical protein
MLQKIRALPQGIKLVIACVICLAIGVLIVGLVQWLS